jgi:hypothetical protein
MDPNNHKQIMANIQFHQRRTAKSNRLIIKILQYPIIEVIDNDSYYDKTFTNENTREFYDFYFYRYFYVRKHRKFHNWKYRCVINKNKLIINFSVEDCDNYTEAKPISQKTFFYNLEKVEKEDTEDSDEE